MLTVEQRVQNGIDLLNEKVPRWHQEIDLHTLNVAFTNTCVLAQLFGHYDKGTSQLNLDLDQTRNCGFTDDYLHDFWLLNQEWKKQINHLVDMELTS